MQKHVYVARKCEKSKYLCHVMSCLLAGREHVDPTDNRITARTILTSYIILHTTKPIL